MPGSCLPASTKLIMKKEHPWRRTPNGVLALEAERTSLRIAPLSVIYFVESNRRGTRLQDSGIFYISKYIVENSRGRTTVGLLKMSQTKDQPPPYQPPNAAAQAQVQMPPASSLGMEPGSKFSSFRNSLVLTKVSLYWNKVMPFSQNSVWMAKTWKAELLADIM